MPTQPEVSGAEDATDHRTVVVIGGGPGGSTAAALLARSGMDVLLLEKTVFPRYHIGESLAASCRLVMDLSGALPDVESFGFPVKRGALLRWGAEEDWTVDWNDLFGPKVSSWQVDRDDFDDLLLRNAGKQGAETVQDATVKKVLFDGDRAVGVEWVHGADPQRVRRTRCDFVIDASGRAGVLTRQHFRCRVPHDVFRNVAIWGYWTGGSQLPATPEGGINVISSEDGWYWVIPLQDNRTSVGFVTHQKNFLKRREAFSSPEEMLHQLIRENETVASLIEKADYYAPVRIEQDFSYMSEKLAGPGYFVVGDAACFLDPLLSTGVHLAMYSALLASAGIISARAGQVAEEEATVFFESLYRHAYSRLLVLVSSVYEQYAGKASYFWLAQRLVSSETGFTKPNSAFGELTAGLSDLSDASHADQRMAGENTAREVPQGRADIGTFRIRPIDLYDEVSGLYLVTTPELGLSRSDGPPS